MIKMKFCDLIPVLQIIWLSRNFHVKNTPETPKYIELQTSKVLHNNEISSVGPGQPRTAMLS